MAAYLEPDKDGVRIYVKLQPRSSRDRVEGEQNGRLKVRLTAPPVGGAANAALIKFMAKVLDVPKGSISLVRGERSREKTLFVAGVTAAAVEARLEEATRRR